MRYSEVPEQFRCRPFTLAEADAAGISRRVLAGRSWRNLFRDVWVHASIEDTRELRLAAIKLILPLHAVVCGLSAAWLYGADVLRADDLDLHVAFPRGKRRRPRDGIIVSQETLAPTDIWPVGGVQVTTPVRTAFDCLRLLRGAERLVVADALTHLQRTTVDEIRAYFLSQRRLRNLRIGQRLVDEIEPATESPMETRLRVRMTDAGLPHPAAQFEVRTPAGAFVARLDLAYPELKIAIEYDGAWHWRQRRDDDRRRDAVRALGWIVIVVSAEDVFSVGDGFIASIQAARRRRTLALSAT